MHFVSNSQEKIWRTVLPVILWLVLLPMGTANASENPSGTHVTLKPSAVVTENRVRLGHVAEIKGSDADLISKLESFTLAPAPPLGQSSFLSMETIRQLLLHRACSQRILLGGASSVNVSRACKVISAQKLEQIGREYIEEHMPWRQGQTKIINVRVDDVIIQQTDVTFKVNAQPNEDFLGDVSLLITIIGKNRTLKQAWWHGEVVVPTDIVVAQRFLRRGETITESDVITKSVALDDQSGAAAVSFASVVGKKVRKEIRPGQAIRAEYLHESPVIKRGDVVMVVAESKLLRVTTQGRAKEDGRPGDSIRVMNLASKKEITGLVEGPALIKVAY
jgi:flagella basal body P-ring formation protein FlgA